MKNKVIIADGGNTLLKLAVFENDSPSIIYKVQYQQLSQWFHEHQDLASLTCVFSTVTTPNVEMELRSFFLHVIKIDQQSKLTFKNSYETPQTLGIDRLCNAAAISFLAKGKNVASIDIGTCVKFDFVDQNGVYCGGSISPGILLRYKALNDYTANLPLLDTFRDPDLVGTSTNGSIHSGVINGIQAEISGIMERYKIELGDLTFFVTGGDASFFDFEGKNNIFADENLTLKGLYYIYQANAQ